MCHFWAPLLFSLIELVHFLQLISRYTYHFQRYFLLYLSQHKSPLDLWSQCNPSKIVFFSLIPIYMGQACLLLSPVISCKGPFSSSLPCSVSVALPQIHKSLSLILFNLIGSPPVCPLVSRSCILCGVSTNSRHRCQQGPRILSSLGCIHRIPHKTAL